MPIINNLIALLSGLHLDYTRVNSRCHPRGSHSGTYFWLGEEQGGKKRSTKVRMIDALEQAKFTITVYD
jgi:hypothetical protein